MKTYKNAERTKKWIRKAFVELLAEKKTLNKISVIELAERADITKTTFYYHYDDIFAVADEMANEMIQELSDMFDSLKNNSNHNYEIYVKRTISFLKEKENDYKMIINSTYLNFFIDRLKKLIIKKFDIPSLEFSSDEDIRKVQITFLSSAIVDTLVEYFKGSFNCSIDKIGDIIDEAINKLKANNI